MPKAYRIARVDVTDAEQYKLSAQRLDPVIAQFGGRFLVCSGQSKPVEGASRNVVIEFPSYQAAQACADLDIVSAEGYDAPQARQAG